MQLHFYVWKTARKEIDSFFFDVPLNGKLLLFQETVVVSGVTPSVLEGITHLLRSTRVSWCGERDSKVVPPSKDFTAFWMQGKPWYRFFNSDSSSGYQLLEYSAFSEHETSRSLSCDVDCSTYFFALLSNWYKLLSSNY